MKGQSSLELVSIVGIALIIAAPFLVESQRAMVTFSEGTEDYIFQTSIDELNDAVRDVSRSGELSQRTVEFEIPSDTESIEISETGILYRAGNRYGSNSFTVASETSIEPINMPQNQGIYEIEVEQTQGTTFIKNTPSDSPYFLITQTQHDEQVNPGENFNAKYKVQNIGEKEATQNIEYKITRNGEEKDSNETHVEGLTLTSGEQSNVKEIEWDTSGEETGDYELEVSSENSTDTFTFKIETST